MEIAEYLDRKIYSAIVQLYIDVEQRIDQISQFRAGTWSIDRETKWKLMNIITVFYCYKVITDIYLCGRVSKEYKNELDKIRDKDLAVETMINNSPWRQIADHSINKLFEYNFEDDEILAITRFENMIKDYLSTYMDFADKVYNGSPGWMGYFFNDEIENLQGKILRALRIQNVAVESFFGEDWAPPYYTKLGPTLLYVPEEDKHLIEI